MNVLNSTPKMYGPLNCGFFFPPKDDALALHDLMQTLLKRSPSFFGSKHFDPSVGLAPHFYVPLSFQRYLPLFFFFFFHLYLSLWHLSSLPFVFIFPFSNATTARSCSPPPPWWLLLLPRRLLPAGLASRKWSACLTSAWRTSCHAGEQARSISLPTSSNFSSRRSFKTRVCVHRVLRSSSEPLAL